MAVSSTSTASPEKVDLNTMQTDVWNLYHLLDATMGLLMEMTYERDGKRDVELDRVAALAWIARDRAHHLGLNIDNNFQAIQQGKRQ